MTRGSISLVLSFYIERCSPLKHSTDSIFSTENIGLNPFFVEIEQGTSLAFCFQGARLLVHNFFPRDIFCSQVNDPMIQFTTVACIPQCLGAQHFQAPFMLVVMGLLSQSSKWSRGSSVPLGSASMSQDSHSGHNQTRRGLTFGTNYLHC